MTWADLSALPNFGFSPVFGFIPFLVLFFLAVASIADARTGRVPDSVIAVGLFITIASLAWGSGWLLAGERVVYIVAAVLALRLVNYVYFYFCNHDAFGFGDAKWTGLAVAGFGFVPVCWAWVIGAWLALIWMGCRWLWRNVSPTYGGHVYVHFAPFLFLGLILALYKDPLLIFIFSQIPS